jgi:Asp-tRNA(Asn)/Glu-tRNA(Gln) amidotransferase A subunit family amidase
VQAEKTVLMDMRIALISGRTTPGVVVEQALSQANSNAGKNVYLSLDSRNAMREAEAVQRRFLERPKPPLYGLPISLKDCFDLDGYPTTCGSRYYAERSDPRKQDSAMARRLREQGAIIVGKTHLNPLAYGLTGENAEYGDCLQPKREACLTGGSSSGAAASVQEGSAVAAAGTDTGGSLRVPAALCGLASYRASWQLPRRQGLWKGCCQLAPSFDTMGWIFRDLRDAPLLAEGFLGLRPPLIGETEVRVGCVPGDFLHDCDAKVLSSYSEWKNQLQKLGATIAPLNVDFWEEAVTIFSSIQAKEAAAIHGERTGGDFSAFEAGIIERLTWGAAIPACQLDDLRNRHVAFQKKMDAIFHEFEFVILPCSPLSRLQPGSDHGETRRRMLRYTAPVSLAGVPVITLPSKEGAGVQLAAARGGDLRLLAYAAEIGMQNDERGKGGRGRIK